MRIVVLGLRGGWYADQFLSAAREMGVFLELIEYRRIVSHLGRGLGLGQAATNRSATGLIVEGVDLTHADRILVRHVPRGNLEQVVFRMDALLQAERAGVRVVNSSKAIEACVDKYLATARLAAAGIPVPPTVVCEDVDSALAAWDRLGGDCLLKPLFGSEGRGILRLNERELASRVFDAIVQLGQVFYLQAFLESPGFDVRAFVVGSRVVAAMKRTSNGDFRTNAALGGQCEPFDLPRAWADLAIRSAEVLGAEIAGVDLLPSRRGDAPVVLEANSAPGFRALMEVTGAPIAHHILEQVMG